MSIKRLRNCWFSNCLSFLISSLWFLCFGISANGIKLLLINFSFENNLNTSALLNISGKQWICEFGILGKLVNVPEMMIGVLLPTPSIPLEMALSNSMLSNNIASGFSCCIAIFNWVISLKK